MPQFLLMIKKRNWDNLTLKWLQPKEIQADPLGDLRTSDGNLSVWHIEADKSNLDLVITALAANRERPDKFEYGLFDQKTLNGVKVKILRTPGRTPIDTVNVCHRDLRINNRQGGKISQDDIHNFAEKKTHYFRSSSQNYWRG